MDYTYHNWGKMIFKNYSYFRAPVFSRDFLRFITGKSLSEALILASTNPQYGKRLLIKLRVQYIKTTSSNMYVVFVLTFRTIYVHKMF